MACIEIRCTPFTRLTSSIARFESPTKGTYMVTTQWSGWSRASFGYKTGLAFTMSQQKYLKNMIRCELKILIFNLESLYFQKFFKLTVNHWGFADFLASELSSFMQVFAVIVAKMVVTKNEKHNQNTVGYLERFKIKMFCRW